jgi:hypothetical protein
LFDVQVNKRRSVWQRTFSSAGLTEPGYSS